MPDTAWLIQHHEIEMNPQVRETLGEQAFKDMKQYKYGPDFLHPEFKKFVPKYQPKTAAVATSQQ